MTEREIKLPVAGVDSMRAKLAEQGWLAPRGVAFERNTIYDTPDQTIRGAGELLRIREAGGRGAFTFKGPQRITGGHQEREEHETPVEDPAALHRIVRGLGFEPSWVYEKRRTRYERDGEAGVIELDETPIGNFLELEGPGDWIDRTAAELGFTPKDYVAASYRGLFERWRELTGRSDQRDMTFEPSDV